MHSVQSEIEQSRFRGGKKRLSTLCRTKKECAINADKGTYTCNLILVASVITQSDSEGKPRHAGRVGTECPQGSGLHVRVVVRQRAFRLRRGRVYALA